MIPESLRAVEAAADKRHQSITGRRAMPHTRCGICDEPLDVGERGVYVDDERCHAHCARGADA